MIECRDAFEKPLFIPLNAEHYLAFENGTKRNERRIYGPRWNEKTCHIGRRVTLSYGYGKARRISGTIIAFYKFDAHAYRDLVKCQIMSIYGTLDKPIADISIEVDPECLSF